MIPLVYFFLCFPCPRGCIAKVLLPVMSDILLPVFSSMIFIVWQRLKSSIHFELILVYGVRYQSSFIFLHKPVQFS